MCVSICVCADIDAPDITVPAVISVVVVAVVLVIVVLAIISHRNKAPRQTTAPAAPTVRRMITPVGTVAEETSISVPTARETGIRSVLTSEAVMIMPSTSSVENFVNLPVAIGLPAPGSVNLPVATAQSVPIADSVNMPVATARSAPGSANMPVATARCV